MMRPIGMRFLGRFLIVAGIAGTAWLLLPERETGRAERKAPVDGLRWSDAARTYAVSVRNHARVRMPGQPKPQVVDQLVEGTLHMRVLDAGPEEVRVGFQMAPLRLRLKNEQHEGRSPPFLATFGRDGAVRAFEFPRTTPDRVKDMLSEAVRTFQCVVSSREEAWETRESHGLGDYDAAYRRTGGTVEKEKTGYPDASVEVERSEHRFDLSAVCWIDRASISETVRIENRTAGIEGRTLATLRIVAPAFDSRLALARLRGSYEEMREAVLRHHTKAPKAPPTALPPPTRRAVVETVRGLNASDGSKAAFINDLRNQLRAVPAFTDVVVDALEAEGTTDGTDAALLNALGIAGTKESQAALVDVLLSPERRRENRLRAAVAISFCGAPNETSMDALWVAADKPDADLANTSLLAIGTAAGTLRMRGDAAARTHRRRLVERLVRDPEVALKALGNTRDPAAYDAIAARLADEDGDVRAAAAYALRTMPGAIAADVLAERLRAETAPAVRRAIAGSLARMKDPTAHAVEVAAGQIEGERDEPARFAMAELLAAHGGSAHGELLGRMLKRETSKRIRVTLAEALYGKDEVE